MLIAAAAGMDGYFGNSFEKHLLSVFDVVMNATVVAVAAVDC